MIYEGYVLVSELRKKCGVSGGAFHKNNGYDIEKLGYYNVVKTKTLPAKYRATAECECTDLGKYLPLIELERILGLPTNHLASMNIKNLIHMKTKKVLTARLVQLTDDFIDQIRSKKTPFYISKQKRNAEFADVIIDMYGIKIGFY